MKGRVRSFLESKGCGFIDGEDGQSYFVHIDDVREHTPLAEKQEVSFEPAATPKGLRAQSVIPGVRPQAIYLNPDRFIMTRSPSIEGHVIVKVICQNCWREANDPHEAREALKQYAINAGANAVVRLTLHKYSERAGCSNYFHTMHRFYGDAVIAKKVTYTTDPDLIARSQAEMEKIDNISNQKSIGVRSLVRPSAWVFIPTLLWSWARTLAKIFFLLAIRGLKKAFNMRTPKSEIQNPKRDGISLPNLVYSSAWLTRRDF
jgi:cold shock CspA family protein